MEFLLPILDWVLPIAAAVLTLLLAALAKKHIGKLGIERSAKVDDMIDRYVAMGVDAAEGAAKTAIKAKTGKMRSEDKKATAVNVVLKELEQSGIKDVAEELISARIEALLEGKESGKSTGESDSTTA